MALLETILLIRPIPATDLANICPLPIDLQFRSLRSLKAGWGPFSYDPTKRAAPDTFNAGTELFGYAQPTSLEQLRKRVIAECRRGDEEIAANLEVTECLHRFAVDNIVRAKLVDIAPYTLSSAVGISYAFWLPLVLLIGDQLLLPFIDPRRTRGLSASGRRFAFSMAHHRVRELYPDLAGAELAIFRFPSVTDARGVTARRLQTFLAADGPLYTYEELDLMVAKTYQIWQQVLAERQDEARRASGGRRGTLL